MCIYKTICPPSYNRNSFVANHALGHIMYPSVELPQIHCDDKWESTLFS